jgi:hypothetical protein
MDVRLLCFVVFHVGSDFRSELITHSEESYRVCCVCLIVCDLKPSRTRRSRPDLGCCATDNKLLIIPAA